MNKSYTSHITPRDTAETRCELAVRLLARLQHENGRTHREQQSSSGVMPQHTGRDKGERWNRDMLLGILGSPWSLQDGRVEVDPTPAAPARYIPMVNPEVQAGPAVTNTRNEDNVRRIYITKKMVSEFGATLGCKACFGDRPPTHGGVPSQDHHPNGKRSCTRETSRKTI